MTNIQYPESIYHGYDASGNSLVTDSSTGYGRFAELGYLTGLEDGKKLAMSESLDGYSNLTEAITHGVNIDWPKLNGIKAKCVNSELGILNGKLYREQRESDIDKVESWLAGKTDLVWDIAISDAWDGVAGWSLWIEGDIPLKLPTADKLEPGSVFVGKNGRITEPKEFVVAYSTYEDDEDSTVAYPLGVIEGDCFYASGVDVIEVKSGGFHTNTEILK